MPPPAFLTGVLSGFTKRAAESRLLARQDQEAQDKKETDILSELTKSDNPDISHAAITGLLDIASGQKKPKGGYLARLMGPNEVTIHPAVTSMMQLIKGGTRTELPAPTLGSMSLGQAPSSTPSGTIPTPPPAAGAAAMPPPPNKPGGGITPPTGGVQVGTPPDLQPVPNHPDTTIPAGPPLQFGSTGRPAGPPTVIRTPTHIFDTPEEKTIKLSRAKSQGDVEGEVAGLVAAGFDEQEARGLIKEKYAKAARGGASGFQSVFGETQDEHGNWVGTTASFDRAAGVWRDINGDALTSFRKSTTSPSSTRVTTTVTPDSIALMRYGMPYSDPRLSMPQRQSVDQEYRTSVQNISFNRQAGSNNANAIRPFTPQEVFTNEGDLRSRLFQYTQHAQQTVQMGYVINEAKAQMDQALIEGAPMGAQGEALINAFKRITDELSAVRNEEYDRSAQNQSFYNRIEGWWTKVTQGGAGVAKAEADNIVKMASAIVEGRRHYIQDQATATYQAGASRGFNPANFLTPDQMEMLGVRGRSGGGPPPAGPEGVTKGMFVGAGDLLPDRVPVRRNTDPVTGQIVTVATLPDTKEIVEVRMQADGKYHIIR